MITGQFKGELFAEERWNTELQSWFKANDPDWIVNNFEDLINYGNTLHNLINILNV